MSRCIIPPSVLENLMCSECGRPLSVGPVRVKLNGQNICGRCNAPNNPDMVLSALNSAYEAAVSMYLFPCIYKPSGCPTYIPFNDATQHETMCLYRTYQCPVKSDCPWTDIIGKLPEHYLANHPELCTENTSIELQLEPDFFQPYLIYHEDMYFLLQTKCVTNEDKLWFSFVYLGNPETVEFIRYKLTLGSNQTKTRILLEEQTVVPHMYMHMDLNKSVNIDRNGVTAILKQRSINCSWSISIDKKYQLQQSQLSELQCLRCDNFMTPPIYICKQGHIFCADCKGFEMDCNWCKDDEKITPLIRAQFLEDLSKKFKFPCRWEGCSHKSNEIRKHEQSCLMRKYQCPFKYCTKWSGSLTDLIEHLKTSHIQCCVHVDASSTIYRSGGYYYIIAYKQLFLCHFEIEESDVKEGLLLIYYKGPPSLASKFRYELEVVNTTGISQVYELSRFIKNRYEVRVPISDDNYCDTPTYNIKIIKRCESQINIQI